jgi:hypothetical protein
LLQRATDRRVQTAANSSVETYTNFVLKNGTKWETSVPDLCPENKIFRFTVLEFSSVSSDKLRKIP